MGRLSGKIAIVTGTASGQGAAEARLFASKGAKVVATDIQTELLEEVV
ncbi:SDR family NAD(P)-dependent oxidoreductase [Neobacillus sp. MM2021_6]|nr:SDR family NAD(P)-dependent oxidoreductase [Neobacillus sp. MM2021_6]NHC20796.1 SDR family NAD(P)-dependent oxidoreductase [Bacillus sp. MM2020_4]